MRQKNMYPATEMVGMQQRRKLAVTPFLYKLYALHTPFYIKDDDQIM